MNHNYDNRCQVEEVRIDGKTFRIFHLLLFAGTDKEVRVPTAEYALEEEILKHIANRTWREVRAIDEKYAYFLPEETDTNDVEAMIESIENIYEFDEEEQQETPETL